MSPSKLVILLTFSLFLCNTLLWAQESPAPANTTQEEGRPQGWSFEKRYESPHKWYEQERFAFDPQAPWKTNAVLIIQDDKILYEKYANGFSPEKPHRLWSVSKSLAAAILSLRLKELSLDLDTPISKIYPDLDKGLKKKLTFRHLLQMSSGLQWNELYESNPFESHVVDMLYINHQKDMGAFVASRPLAHHPGEFFNYSSGETNLLMKVLRSTFKNQEEYDQYPWQKLFSPIGIRSATFEQDGAGTFVGSSYAFMTARDLARFGRLMMSQGKWIDSTKDKEEERTTEILDPRFVKESFQMAPSVCQTFLRSNTNKMGYGLHWWLNRECPSKGLRRYPDLPQELKMALGHHGQMLVLFPKENAMVVRFGADKKSRLKANDWLKLVHQGLKRE